MEVWVQALLLHCFFSPRRLFSPRAQFFKRWITQLVSLTLICQIVIYPVDSAIWHLNDQDQVYKRVLVTLQTAESITAMDQDPTQGRVCIGASCYSHQDELLLCGLNDGPMTAQLCLVPSPYFFIGNFIIIPQFKIPCHINTGNLRMEINNVSTFQQKYKYHRFTLTTGIQWLL